MEGKFKGYVCAFFFCYTRSVVDTCKAPPEVVMEANMQVMKFLDGHLAMQGTTEGFGSCADR